MDVKRVEEIKAHLEVKSTRGLLDIWLANDHKAYTEEAFAAIKILLEERNSLLPQPEPVEQPTDSLDSQFTELQDASSYRIVHKTLKYRGIGSIIFGIIALAVGFGGMQENPINGILVLIGLFLLIEGVWVVSSPKPAGMIVDGIAMLTVGIWNILVTIANIANDGGFQFFIVIGVWQIIWGCQSFQRYKRFSKMPVNKPSKETLKQIDDLMNTIIKVKAKEQDNIIEFKTNRPQQLWKGKLSQNTAIFVERTGQDIMFAAKHEVDFIKEGKSLLGKALKASFGVRERKLTGTIMPEYFERFEMWKVKT